MNIDLTKYKAKPNESIEKHNQELLNRLMVLQELGYISDELMEQLKICCFCHDLGKVNPEFQNRVINGTHFDSEKEVIHNVLSIFLMNRAMFNSDEDYYRCLNVVLNHHNYGNPYEIIAEKRDLIKELLVDFDVEMVKRKTLEFVKSYAEEKNTMLLRGYLMKLDYSASGHFAVEYPNDFLEAGVDEFFESHNYKRNELQQYAKAHSSENVMIVAGTGAGKTEAALSWAGNSKIFFHLPLQALNNSIYQRICNMIPEQRNKIGLLHSNSLNVYANNLDSDDILNYYQMTKQLSLAVNVATLDQLFDFVFKVKGSEMKLATLSYSKVIIDEIQAYDNIVLARLITGLKILREFGSKVCITTATLPPFIKNELENILGVKTQTFLNDTIRHNVKVLNKHLTAHDIIEYHQNNPHKKILIVCNTVKKAQQLYKDISEANIQNVKLLHSKFNWNDRKQKEEDIMSDGETNNTESCIWISTQIVEAGLDIDFDVLFTELSELSGLFQRMGRCNRKGLKPVSDYNCFVYTKIEPYLLNKVVDETLYKLSVKALQNVNGILSEQDKQDLIEQAFSLENIRDSAYYLGYKRECLKLQSLQYADLDKKEINFREIEDTRIVMPVILYEANFEFIKEQLQILQNSSTSYLEKINAKQELKNLTVSIPRKKKVRVVETPISLSNYEVIEIVDCLYDEHMGFEGTQDNNLFI